MVIYRKNGATSIEDTMCELAEMEKLFPRKDCLSRMIGDAHPERGVTLSQQDLQMVFAARGREDFDTAQRVYDYILKKNKR